MGVIIRSLTISALLVSGLSAQTRKTSNALDIYVVDAEGGAAALFVAPSGETALIDSGNPGGRDTDRIMAVLAEAGVKRIDYLISTHYHIDHIGGLQELAKRVPIGHYVDHGPTVEEKEQVAGFQQAYAELYGKVKHTVVKPGDTLPIAGLDWRIVTAAGKVIKTPLAGGGKPNPFCAGFTPRPNSGDENTQSVGSVIDYGKFRLVDLGDLMWNNEFDLMCPNNPIGTVDLYITSHHGTDPSGSEALVHALAPRVAITQNGTRKGGTVQTSQILNSSPNFEDVWQLHWSYTGGIEHNPAGLFIANVDEPATIATVLVPPPPGPTNGRQAGPGGARGPAHTGPAFWIKVTARSDGSFTVTNTRNGFTKTYAARK